MSSKLLSPLRYTNPLSDLQTSPDLEPSLGSADAVTLMDTRLHVLSWEQTIGRIVRWATAAQSRTICLCNVHSLMTATSDPELHTALRNADINLADGAPIAWLMRRRGWPEQQRLAGPDLMKKLLAEAERHQLPVFLFGTSPAGLARLNTVLQAAFPTLAIVGLHSPPFRDLSVEEDTAIIEQVRASGARLLLVGLGCPKQEKWMQRQRGKMPAVMIGLGAAFDYCSGLKQRAPIAWQRMGLEWLYRLGQEPRRLLIRYLLTNFLFLIHLPWELRKTQGRR